MILGMIQTIVTTKLIFAATVYVFTLVFKIWWEIKQHKLHDKSVIYYDNEHHGHTYDLPEHEYDEHHEHPFTHHDHHAFTPSSGWSLWGRSYAPSTATSVLPPGYGGPGPYQKPLPYYIRPKINPAAGGDEDEFS